MGKLTSDGRVFIYGLVDPRTQELRYVGKTKYPNRRLLDHCKSPGRRARNRRTNWLGDVIRSGHAPEMFVLEETDAAGWSEAERFYISYFRMLGSRLVNGNDGGFGWNEATPEQRESMSRGQQERSAVWRERLSAALKGRRPSAQCMARAVEALTGKPQSEEVRQRKSLKLVGRVFSPETREKIRIAKTGKTHSPESRKKIGDVQRGRKQSPEAIANRVAAQIGQKRSPKTIAAMAAAQKAAHAAKRARNEALIAAGIEPPLTPKEAARKVDSEARANEIAGAYLLGHSCNEVARLLGATSRSVETVVAARGIGRSKKDALRLRAAKRAGTFEAEHGYGPLTDEQWMEIKPFLPPPVFSGRPRRHERQVLSSLLWRLAKGGYGDLPTEPAYAKVPTTDHQLSVWANEGVLGQIEAQLRKATRRA